MRHFNPSIEGTTGWAGRKALTEDELRRYAPSIFAETKHESRSERYTHIPTIEVIRGLESEGFLPYSVQQGRSRIPGKQDFTKHMIRFRRPESGDREIGKEYFETVLINSHDGTSAYRLMAGVFRMVCLNGMIVGKNTLADVRVPHKGDVVNDVIEGTYSVVSNAEQVMGSIDDMRAIELDPQEQQIMALTARRLRYDDDDAGFELADLLMTRRREDTGSDLWTTFNRLQENTIKGGQLRVGRKNADGKRIRDQRSRPVNSIDEGTKINRALWDMAEMLRSHRGASA